MNREDYAVSLRNRGYNCAQAVICAFADQCDLSEEQLFAVSECFGSGLGCTEGTCGALTAACWQDLRQVPDIWIIRIPRHVPT